MIFGNYTLSFGSDDIRSGSISVFENKTTRIYPVSSWKGTIDELVLPFPDFEVSEYSIDKILISIFEAFEHSNITLLTPFLLNKSYPKNKAFQILLNLIEKFSNEKRRVRTIYTPDVKLWIRDKLFVFESIIGHKSYLLEPTVPQKPKFGLAGCLQKARPNSFHRLKLNGKPQGGNILFGDNFILTTCEEALEVISSTRPKLENENWVDQNGYETRDFCISERYETIQIRLDRGDNFENALKDPVEKFKVVFKDPLYHLDLFANLLGYGENQNEFRILIGKLENASGISNLSPREFSWFEGNNLALNLITEKLQAYKLKSGKTIRVIRSPLPAVCEERNGERKWMVLPYNNALVENIDKKTLLYIPTFSPTPDLSGNRVFFHKDLKKMEKSFLSILKTHKINVKKLANHWKMIEKGGALHCMSLELRRQV